MSWLVFSRLPSAAGMESGSVRSEGTFSHALEPIQVGSHPYPRFPAQRRILNALVVLITLLQYRCGRMRTMGRETLINFYADLGLFERPPMELVETGQPVSARPPGARAEVMTASYGPRPSM